MQWSPDRNGGFSRADFAQLYLPPLMDPVYGFEAVNVEAQQRNPGSFLHWLRGMLVERRSLPVLGVGELEVLACPNPSVLAFVRSGEVVDVPVPVTGLGPPAAGSAPGPPLIGASAPLAGRPASPGLGAGGTWEEGAALTVPADEAADAEVRRPQAVLCVHNLSRFAQPAELLLNRWAGSTPLEVLGRVPFPTVGEEPYTITLGPYGYLWFDLVEQPAVPGEEVP